MMKEQTNTYKQIQQFYIDHQIDKVNKEFISEIQKQEFYQKHQRNNIEQIHTLDEYIQSEFAYNEQKKQEFLNKLNQNINYTLKIRGDGNCYFRSFMFLYILQLIQNEESLLSFLHGMNKFDFDIQIFTSDPKAKINLRKINLNELKKCFTKYLIEIYQTSRNLEQIDTKNLIELIRNQFNQNIDLDFTAIVFSRICCLFEILNFDQKDNYFMNEQMNIEKYLNILLNFGEDAEELIINCLAAFFNSILHVFRFLKVQNLWKMYEDIFKNDTIYKTNPIINQLSQVKVLLHSGHYLVLINDIKEKKMTIDQKQNAQIKEIFNDEQETMQPKSEYQKPAQFNKNLKNDEKSSDDDACIYCNKKFQLKQLYKNKHCKHYYCHADKQKIENNTAKQRKQNPKFNDKCVYQDCGKDLELEKFQE